MGDGIKAGLCPVSSDRPPVFSADGDRLAGLIDSRQAIVLMGT